MTKLLVNAVFFLTGVGFNVLYVSVARKKFGVKIDFVQAVMYNIDASSFSFKARMIERVLRWLKFFGILMAVVSLIAIFSQD